MAAYARPHLPPIGNYTFYIIFGDWYLMAAFTRQHLLPFGNYTLHYLADPSLETMGSDKKNKRIESQETRDCYSGSSCWRYLSFIHWNKWVSLAYRRDLS
jgi:hypothetical protein